MTYYGSPRSSNAVSDIPLSEARGDRWEAYDRLPQPIQRYLQACVVDICAIVIGQRTRDILRFGDAGDMIPLALQAFETAEQTEVELFSSLYERLHRRPSAHVAAQATICRPNSRRQRALPGATNQA